MELASNSFKFRLFVGVVFIFAGFIILPIIFAFFSSNYSSLHVEAADPSTSFASAETSDNPNVITNGMGSLLTGFDRTASSTEKTVANSLNTTADNFAKGGKAVAQAGIVTGKVTFGVLQKSLLFTARTVGNTAVFIIRVPGKIIGSVGKIPSPRSLIRPSENAKVPVIDSQLSALYSAHPSPTPQKPTPSVSQVSQNTIWPIHGQITTQFGVPHRPYQVTHTGLDISSGQRAGATAVHAFKAGKVIGVVRSSQGLGNHLIIDHGGGLTSVYGHLYSISVNTGQQVDNNTILGYEGSTGASTGPHLHFEVRINGQPVNPSQYINGRP